MTKLLYAICTIFILAECTDRPFVPIDNVSSTEEPEDISPFYYETIISCQDLQYKELFKKGLYDSIINIHDKNFDMSSEFLDYKKGIYNLAFLEVNNYPSVSEFCKQMYPEHLWNERNSRVYYTENMLTNIGSYEAFSLMVCDFTNYKLFDLMYEKLSHEVYSKMCDENKKDDLFLQLNTKTINTSYNDETDTFIDSVKSQYSSWRYLDTLKKFYGAEWNKDQIGDTLIPLIQEF